MYYSTYQNERNTDKKNNNYEDLPLCILVRYIRQQCFVVIMQFHNIVMKDEKKILLINNVKTKSGSQVIRKLI